MARVKERRRRMQGKCKKKKKRKDKTMKGARKKKLRQIWRTQGQDLHKNQKLGIPRTVLDVRSNRTHGRVLMESRWYRGGRCRLPKKWRTPESEDGVVGGVRIVGNVVEQEGTGRSGCRSTYWAHEDPRNGPCEIREGRRVQ